MSKSLGSDNDVAQIVEHITKKSNDSDLVLRRNSSDKDVSLVATTNATYNHDSQSKSVTSSINEMDKAIHLAKNMEKREKRLKKDADIKVGSKRLKNYSDWEVDTIIEVACVGRDEASVALYNAKGNINDAIESLMNKSSESTVSPNLLKKNVENTSLDKSYASSRSQTCRILRDYASARNILKLSDVSPSNNKNISFSHPQNESNLVFVAPSPSLRTSRKRRYKSSFDRIIPHLRGMHTSMHTNLSFYKRVANYKDDYMTTKFKDMRFGLQSHDDDSNNKEPSSMQTVATKCQVCHETLTDNFSLHCSHPFCMICLNKYIQAQIDIGNTSHILCPMPSSECGKPILQRELQTILGTKKFRKLDRFALESATDTDPNLYYCPTPDCPYIVHWEDDGTTTPKLFCPICDSTSCLKCSVGPYHEGISCEAFQCLPENTRNEHLTASYFEQNKTNLRKCRRCGMFVERTEGSCAKMKCRCGYRFCFVCGVENATCGHTPSNHGFSDNVTGRADFKDLMSLKSPT